MLDFRTNFLNHLINLKKTQFAAEFTTATPATMMALTNAFQIQMKAMVEDKKIPEKYRLHFANLQLVDQFIFQGGHKLPADLSKLSIIARTTVEVYSIVKRQLQADFEAAVTGFDDNNFADIA